MLRVPSTAAALILAAMTSGAIAGPGGRFADNELEVEVDQVDPFGALADWNADGVADILDLLSFIEDWFEDRADVDQDDDTDTFDLLDYMQAYLAARTIGG